MKLLILYTITTTAAVLGFTLPLPTITRTSSSTTRSSASFIITPKKQQQARHSPMPFSKLYNKEQDDDELTGMEKAFASLDEIGSLDLESPVKKLNVDLDADMDTTLSPEELAKKGDLSTDEIKLYKEMYQEIEQGAGEEVYGDILGELNDEMTESTSTSTSKPAPAPATSINTTTAGIGFGKTSSPPAPLDDADGIGAINMDDEEQLTAVELSMNTDEFMRKALEEALAEAKSQTKSTTIDESLLNDKELMNEINAVFDKANDKLMAGVDDMKSEQAELTRKSAANRSKGLEEEEQRLKSASGSVSRLVEKVKQETMEVEKAVAELKDAQESMGDNPLSQAVDLKKAGVVRQSALVGALLFSFRSVGELLAVAQGTGDVEGHGTAAAIQAFIALACGGYLVFF